MGAGDDRFGESCRGRVTTGCILADIDVAGLRLDSTIEQGSHVQGYA